MTSAVYRQSSRREPSGGIGADLDDAFTATIPSAGSTPKRSGTASSRQRPARPEPLRPAGAGRRGRRRPGLARQRLGTAEPLSRGPPDQAGLAAGDFRLPGHGRQLRPPGPQHLGHTVTHADEQRFILSHAAPPRPAQCESTRRRAPEDRSTARRRAAWMLVYQRPITPTKPTGCTTYRRPAARDARSRSELAVLTNLCQQLLISNEFLYVD